MRQGAPRFYIPHERRGLIIMIAIAIAFVTAAAFAYLAFVAKTTTSTIDKGLGNLDKPAAVSDDQVPSFAVVPLGHVPERGASALPPLQPKQPVIEKPVVEREVVVEPPIIVRAPADRSAKRSTQHRVTKKRAAKPQPPYVADTGAAWRPSVADVRAEMANFAGDVQRCYDRGMVPGRVEVTITVRGDTGHVSKVVVSPETSTSRCVAHVMKKGLELPPFGQPELTIKKVYIFR